METRHSVYIACKKNIDKNRLLDFTKSIISNKTPSFFKTNQYTKRKNNKYNFSKCCEAFEEEFKSLDGDKFFELSWEKGYYFIESKKNEIPLKICMLLDEELTERLRNDFEKVIVEDGIIAHEVNLRDSNIQNESFIDMLEYYGENADNYPKCKGTVNDVEIDIKKNPGYLYNIRGFMFGALYRMWFGKESYEFFDKGLLRSFRCFENVELGNDVTRITLYDNILDYNKKDYRDKQWAFRRELQIDEIEKILDEKSKEEQGHNVDSKVNILEGEFEHGGSRLIQTFMKDGEIAYRSEADSVEERELDKDGNEVFYIVRKLQKTN